MCFTLAFGLAVHRRKGPSGPFFMSLRIVLIVVAPP